MSDAVLTPDEEAAPDAEAEAAPAKGNGQTAASKPDRRPLYRRPGFIVFFSLLVIASIVGFFFWLDARHFEDTDDATIDGHVIPINPQVPAMVSSVHVDDNMVVHKGDLLIELDPTDYTVALNQARGAEAAAKGKLEQAKSGITSAQAAVAEAQAALISAQTRAETAERDLKRYQGLDERSRSQQQEDNATSAQKSAAADVEQAKAQILAAQSQVVSAQANVVAAQGDYEKAQADTHKAEVNLGYCHIVAATDGRITNKVIEPGMYVTTSSQLFNLVPADVWVTANFKETQLNLMRPGQPVQVFVDAYAGKELDGTVDSIQAGTGARFSVIPPENATGNFVKVVQRVPVKIKFKSDANADPQQLLSPGMSVEAKVRVRD